MGVSFENRNPFVIIGLIVIRLLPVSKPKHEKYSDEDGQEEKREEAR